MSPFGRPPRDPRRISLLLLTPLFLLGTLAGPTWAQPIPDPCQSDVDVLCDNIIFVPPYGYGDPLGDLGLLITVRDASGIPIPGIPASAFEFHDQGGSFPFILTGTSDLSPEQTDDEGRIALIRRLQGFGPALGMPLLISVTVGANTVFLDCNPTPTVDIVSPDMNGDGAINLADIGEFVSCYAGAYCVQADFNGNGEMDFGDLVIFRRYYGFSGPIVGKTPLPKVGQWPSVAKAGEERFLGCLQLDFDDDADPSTITDSLFVIPSMPMNLKVIVKDFSRLSGVNLALVLPPDLTLFPGGCITAESPFSLSLGGSSDCGQGTLSLTPLDVGSALCLDEGPVFVAQITFWGQSARWVRLEEFTLSGELADCLPRPTLTTACIGSPTPCEVSSLEVGNPNFLTCPGADMDLDDIVTLTLRDQDGAGLAGVSASEVEMSVFDELGSNEGDRFRIQAIDPESDENGEIRYLFEAREACRWDGCFELLITARLEACELTVSKSVRTLNLVRYEDDPLAAGFDEINESDELEMAARVATLDPCADLLGLYRCPMVAPSYLTMLQSHLGHSCSVTAAPEPIPARWSPLEQNVPNPFNPRTRITVRLDRPATTAVLEIYTLDGRFLRRVWNGPLPEGESRFHWDGTDANAMAVSSGVYLARLITPEYQDSIRMVLLR